MTTKKKLFLLDGMALAYRAYFALISRPLYNSKGENTSAIYGFVNTLMKILDEERPDHIAVVFDTKEPTFRHEQYSEYKATREKMPEDLGAQLGRLKEAVRAFRVPTIEVPGFEADDVIGTIAKEAADKGMQVFMVTGDKDFMQLVSPSISIYKPGKAGGEPEIIGEAGVKEKFGVEPHRVIDVLGLMGDSSDNVPGVPGVGPKTAIPLIQKFGTIPELYERLDEVSQKGTREKLQNNRESAFLSRTLVTIKTDVPVDTRIGDLVCSEPDYDALQTLFGELEFKTLAGRLKRKRLEAASATPAPEVPEDRPLSDISGDQHTYTLVTTQTGLDALIGALGKAKRIVIDTETTSEDPLLADLIGIALCAEERHAFFIPLLPDSEEDLFSLHESWRDVPLKRSKTLSALKPILEDPSIGKYGQNIKYDLLVLRRAGVETTGVEFDTMVASYVLRPDSRHGLEALAKDLLGYRMISYEDLAGSGKSQKDTLAIPLERLAEYSAEDADITMRIVARQQDELASSGLTSLCTAIEFPLISVLAAMEFAGIRLDTAHLSEMSKKLEAQITNLVAEIHSLAGEEFNINSTKQLAEILFEKFGLPTFRKTKTGYSTNASVLESLRGQHPIIGNLLEYRLLTKLKSTYVDALPELVNPETGRVHTSFNQTVAATGRLASNDPNLQNIPIRTETGRLIRKAFVPESSDLTLLSADYSQVELRVMAHICDDPGLTEAFRKGEDIHATTAAKVFGVPPGEITPDMRRKAKEVNFGIMYGLSPFGLAMRLEISQTEAKEIISNYFVRFPKVKQYIHDTIASAHENGFVTTLLGRRRYLPDINSKNRNIRMNAERQAINMPIQGTAADMIKKAMITIDAEIRRRSLKARMLLQVHDELLLELPHSETEETRALVAEKMTNALPLSVPVEVEIGTGEDWLAAH